MNGVACVAGVLSAAASLLHSNFDAAWMPDEQQGILAPHAPSSPSVTSMSAPSDPIDFAIITALKLERDAVLRRLDAGYATLQEQGEPLTFYHGHVSIPSSGERYSVVVTLLLNMGNEDAAVAATRIIQRWRPNHVLMVGIAGGLAGKVALGDVVVADTIYYYEPAKLTPDGAEGRPADFVTSRLLYGRAQAYEASEWKGDVGIKQPGAGTSELPEARFGVIAAGEKVVADRETLPRLLRANPKVIAVAMEGAGLAKAALLHHPPPAFLEIRGISDFADENKSDDEWRPYAASAAAAFTIGLLRSRPIPPLAEKGLQRTGIPLVVLQAQSLRPIAPAELEDALATEGRDVEIVALDFTDLVRDDVLVDLETAVRRVGDPQGPLFGALARRGNAEVAFHGLVHIPLAALIGHLVTDRQRVQMFDFHPDVAAGTWKWPAGEEAAFSELEVSGLPTRRINREGEAVVAISISYRVDRTQLRRVIGDPLATIEMKLAQPERGVVKSEAQTRAYGRAFRRVIDTIAQCLPMCGRIHLFYSGPVSLAFHLGQQISANIHPAVAVWNFRRGAYEWGIDLAGAARGAACVVYPTTHPQRGT